MPAHMELTLSRGDRQIILAHLQIKTSVSGKKMKEDDSIQESGQWRVPLPRVVKKAHLRR